MNNPGTSVRATYGSDVRRAVEFEHGGKGANGPHWYLAGNFFAEDGWRVEATFYAPGAPTTYWTGTRVKF